jgi:uncharacterized membrane protein
MWVRYLRLMYVFACMVWSVYFSVGLLRIPVSERNPHVSGFVLCLFVVVIFPSALGYWLLFKALPWAGRRLEL